MWNRLACERLGFCSDLTRRWVFVCLCCFLAVSSLSGCRKLTRRDHPAEEFRLPAVPRVDNSVNCEVGLIELPAAQSETWSALWNQLDSQSIDLEQRKLLDSNGFRGAVIPVQPPMAFWHVIDPPMEYASEDERDYQEKLRSAQGKPAQKNLLQVQQVALGPGQAHRVETTPFMNALAWKIVGTHSHPSPASGSEPAPPNSGYVRSGQFQLAQCKMRIAAFRRGGQVIVRLTPEIFYGESRPRFSGSLVSTHQQERMSFHELAVEIPVQVGETAICSCIDAQNNGLGHQFFRSADGLQIRGIYVRVTSAPDDQLFAE